MPVITSTSGTIERIGPAPGRPSGRPQVLMIPDTACSTGS